MTIRILAFSGSSRRASLNQRMLDIATAGAEETGAQVQMLRLGDLQLPIFDGDWEAEHGLPPGAVRFKALLAEQDALLIATPEHNGGYTAMLKNALDWASRPNEKDPTGLGCFSGKLAAMVSASPGQLGAIRSQIALQVALCKIGLYIIPASFALGSAHQAFDDRGALKDARVDEAIRKVGAALARAAVQHAGNEPA